MSLERIPSSESLELDNIPLEMTSRSSSESCELVCVFRVPGVCTLT